MPRSLGAAGQFFDNGQRLLLIDIDAAGL